jgi:hypothetical protein
LYLITVLKIFWWIKFCFIFSKTILISRMKLKLKLKLKYDRQSVGLSVLVSGALLGPATSFSSLLEMFFRQLRVCYFVAPSLTRGQVCNLLLLLGLASAVPLGFESPRDSRPYFIVPIFETPLKGQVHVFISP